MGFYLQKLKRDQILIEKRVKNIIINRPIDERMKFIINYSKNKNVLNVGCADNFTLHKEIGKVSNKLIGIDINKEKLDNFTKKNFIVYKKNAESFSFNTKFDLIIAGELIEHLPNPGLFLKNSKKMLRQNGELIITTPNMTNIILFLWFIVSKKLQDSSHLAWYEEETLKVLLDKYNFEISKILYIKPTYKTVSDNKFINFMYMIGVFMSSIIYLVNKRIGGSSIIFMVR